MTRVLRGLAVLVILGGSLGCATKSPNEMAWLPDSSLANLHPAPKSMAPQSFDSEGDPAIDAMHLRAQADYNFTMGEAYSFEGQPEKAIESFKLTLVYDPNSVAVRLRLATEYVRVGLVSEAIERAEEAVRIDPKATDGRLLLGGLYSSLRMFTQAAEQYQTILSYDAEHEDVPIFLGAILAEQEKYDEAIGHFTKVARNPKFKAREKAWYYIGRIRTEKGGKAEQQEGEAAFRQALKIEPTYEDAVMALANLLLETEREPAAIQMLQSFQDRFGPKREVARLLARLYLARENFPKAYAQLEHLEGFERDNISIRAQMALILIESKRYDEAVIRLEDILAQAPELDKVRYYLGAVYEEMKKTDLAIQNYGMIPPSSSYFTEATLHTANLHRQNSRVAEAIKLMKGALALREDIPQFYAYYASLLDETKEYRQAIALLEQAVEKFPNQAQLHFFLGSMQDRVGNADGTIAQMQKVLTLDANHVQALNYLAYTYAEIGKNLEDAESMARRALAKSPSDGYILDTVGWVLFKQGRTEQAIRYLEAAYKAKPDEAIIAEHLADAYVRLQLVEKARTLYQRAAELESDGQRKSQIVEKLAGLDIPVQGPLRVPASVPPTAQPASEP